MRHSGYHSQRGATRDRVANLLMASRSPLTTVQIVGLLGLSRSPVYRALCALEAQGRAVRARPAPLKQGDSWAWAREAGGAVA